MPSAAARVCARRRPMLRVGAFRDCERGGTALIFALAAFMLVGFGALSVDVGALYYAKRRQQTANDLAAIAAAMDVPRAQAAARASAAANGFEAADVQVIEPGLYTADARLAVEDRFRPTAAALANAVRVEMESTTPLLLGRVLEATQAPQTPSAPGSIAGSPRSSGEVRIASRAVAMQDMQAAFAIGSRLARVDGGLLNSLLGGLLGGSLSLSVMDYEALAKARIDLFDLSKRLATRASLTAVNYEEVVAAEVKLPQLLLAAQDASRDHGTASAAATDALGRIAARASQTGKLKLDPLVSYGTFGANPVSGPRPIAASLSALDLVSAIAQISNGTRQIDIGLGLSLPGIAAVQLKLGIGERPVGTHLMSVGRSGTTVHTAQTRLLLTIDLVGSGQTSMVRLPLYVELGAATARLSGMQCAPGDVASSRVTLGVTPALVDAWVGQVSNAEFGNFTRAPNPPAATLLNLLGLAKVTARAHATMTNLAETPVSFGYAEIGRGDKRTTSTQNFVATLLGRLFGDLDIRVEVIGLGLGTGGLGAAVGGVVSAAATPIDSLLTSLLGTLGIGLGQADSWVTGVRCGGAVLVR